METPLSHKRIDVVDALRGYAIMSSEVSLINEKKSLFLLYTMSVYQQILFV
jgi:hypothetical protein